MTSLGINTLERYSPSRVPDVTLQRNLDGVARAIDSIEAVPYLNGVLLEDIELGPDSRNDVEHKLGKEYRGWVVMRQTHTPTAFRAYLSSNTSTTTGSVLVADTEDYDYASAYDASTGLYTAPVDGFYRFEASTWWDDLADGNNMYFELQVNSGRVRFSNIAFVGAGAADALRHDHFHIRLNKDDVVRIVVFHNFGAARTLLSGSAATYFSGSLHGSGAPYEALETEVVDRTRFLPLYTDGSPTVSLWVF